jgi:hypothetical protein
MGDAMTDADIKRELDELKEINTALLGALETAVSVISLQCDVVERGQYKAAWKPTLDLANAAIDKAKGVTP